MRNFCENVKNQKRNYGNFLRPYPPRGSGSSTLEWSSFFFKIILWFGNSGFWRIIWSELPDTLQKWYLEELLQNCKIWQEAARILFGTNLTTRQPGRDWVGGAFSGDIVLAHFRRRHLLNTFFKNQNIVKTVLFCLVFALCRVLSSSDFILSKMSSNFGVKKYILNLDNNNSKRAVKYTISPDTCR